MEKHKNNYFFIFGKENMEMQINFGFGTKKIKMTQKKEKRFDFDILFIKNCSNNCSNNGQNLWRDIDNLNLSSQDNCNVVNTSAQPMYNRPLQGKSGNATNCSPGNVLEPPAARRKKPKRVIPIPEKKIDKGPRQCNYAKPYCPPQYGCDLFMVRQELSECNLQKKYSTWDLQAACPDVKACKSKSQSYLDPNFDFSAYAGRPRAQEILRKHEKNMERINELKAELTKQLEINLENLKKEKEDRCRPVRRRENTPQTCVPQPSNQISQECQTNLNNINRR